MFKMKITPDGGEAFELVTSTRDIAQWEKRNKGASFAGLQADMHMTDLYKIGHIAATRQGLYTGTLKEFEESVDIDMLDDEAEVDPTRSGASAEV